MNIPNLAGLDLPSPNLELMRALSPELWSELERTGYSVAMPDLLGKCGSTEISNGASDNISWYIEVGSDKAVAYIYQMDEGVFLGPKYHLHGTPDKTVAEAKRLMDSTAMEELFSGVAERNACAEVVDVYLN